VDGLLSKNHRLAVPKVLRREMLNTTHKSHLSIVKFKSMAREVLYWPGMSAEVEDTVTKCHISARTSRKNHKEPLQEMDIPERSLSVVSADLFKYKLHH